MPSGATNGWMLVPVSFSVRYTSDGTKVALDHAGRVTKHPIAALEARCRRVPAAAKSISQQLIRVRAVLPHGDRRDRAESSCIEAEEGGSEWDHHIVRVFVLSDDFGDLDARRLGTGPAKQVSKRVLSAERLLNLSDEIRIGCIDRANGYRPHDRAYESGGV